MGIGEGREYVTAFLGFGVWDVREFDLEVDCVGEIAHGVFSLAKIVYLLALF